MRLRVAFCHPDLGLGGAERLIVDAASELANLGHTVDVFTAYYDPQRCFEETRSGQFGVVVAGSWFPRHVFGRCHALCAYVRCILVALYLSWRSYRTGQAYDVVIVDQVSAVVPYLQWFTTAKVLFYCHFPDMLLATRRTLLRRLYRAPLDQYEEYTTGLADCVVVNSRYTQGVFAETFQGLHLRNVVPQLLYPAVRVPSDSELAEAVRDWAGALPPDVAELMRQRPVFLSINRFERKKGLELAVAALRLLSRHAATRGKLPGLVLAGGYDSRLAENREYYEQLQQLVADAGMRDRVVFFRSFTDAQKALLLAGCRAVVYTPQHEHFGIVPLEAMAAGKPVIACTNGGPTESIISGTTGLLADPSPQGFADAMKQLLDDKLLRRMSVSARQHVQNMFSRPAFGNKLQAIIFGMLEDDDASSIGTSG